MTTAILIGAGVAAAAAAGKMALNMYKGKGAGAGAAGLFGGNKFYRGGFEGKMTKREAALILGVRESVSRDKLKEAHRRIMLANHPDKGGSPYIASKINEPPYFAVTARDLTGIVCFDRRNDAEWIREDYWGRNGGKEGLAAVLRTDLAAGLDSEMQSGADATDEKGRFAWLSKLLPKRKGPAGDKQRIQPSPSAPNDAAAGLSGPLVPRDRQQRIDFFGVNKIEVPPPPSLFSLILDFIKEDIIIRILLVGALVILIIGTATHPVDGWYEGVAIFAAVGIVLCVTSLNDWIKEGKFRKMTELKNDKMVKVIRNSALQTISTFSLLVGDLVLLSVGDEVPGDGFVVQCSRLALDESPLTGEPIAVRKDPVDAPFVFGGSCVAEGEGLICITAVGKHSMGGQIQELLFRRGAPNGDASGAADTGNSRAAEAAAAAEDEDDSQTPLQRRLRDVALTVGKIGFSAGLVTFVVLLVRWAVLLAAHLQGGGVWEWNLLMEMVKFFVISVTVVVVAVPEGLPLAVTISLAFSMFRMMKDNCFVRHLDASETMGEATCICTDKTGTLTENRMTVVKVLCKGKHSDLEADEPPTGVPATEEVSELLAEAVAVNSTAFLKDAVPASDTKAPKAPSTKFVGSATEGALLVFARKLGYPDYESIRRDCEKAPDGVWPFSSKRKRMSTLIIKKHADGMSRTLPAGYRLHVKGASEIDRKGMEATIKEWAGQGLRTIVLAYRDFVELPSLAPERKGGESVGVQPAAESENPIETNLVFIALVGINDPLRKEVPAAVKACQGAGMIVRMVTGDNVLTATKIAGECGILDPAQGHVAIEGPEFRAMSDTERRAILPSMRVLARSSPTDKFILVSLLRSMGETVAVTGDGTNDAAALNEADVGFAMGISGTQIAKNASDIVLMDDNFSSIVNAVRWGRNVYDGIRRFLQFQLSVNLVAIIITIVGSAAWGHAPLNSVQLLWVNLIMDSLGAIALASDIPGDEVLRRKPHARSESMISPHMRWYILSIVTYQLAILLAMLFVGESMVPFPPEEAAWCTFDTSSLGSTAIWLDSCRGRWRLTIVFTTFIMLQVFNELTTRQLEAELNPFSNLLRNHTFLLINVVIVGVQVIVVQFGGDFVKTVPLYWDQWLLCTAWAAGSIVWVVLLRIALKLHFAMPSSRRSFKRVSHEDVAAKPKPSWVGELESIKSTSRIFSKSKSAVNLSGQHALVSALSTSRRIVPEGDSIVEIPASESAHATRRHHDEHVSFNIPEDGDLESGGARTKSVRSTPWASKHSVKHSIEEIAEKILPDETVAGIRNRKSLSNSGIPSALRKKRRNSIGSQHMVSRSGLDLDENTNEA
ncbi:hypothetical protein DFJ74DRAFT_771667 [Hyaloraphidium curvatum]|nr:hypothetical protein DFJ74DRAFT_771667 [Hyaloraphidium curvatum]